jgi:hypothetical protein
VKKWSILNYGEEMNLLDLSNSSFYAEVDYQEAYLTYSYSTADHPNEGSEGLLYNCANFFVVGVPLVIMGFVLLRRLFMLLF